MYARLSKKGQVTIPKPIRKKLKIDNDGGVLFLVEDDEVKLKGIPGGQIDKLAGSLKNYAKSYVSLEKVRTRIKGKIADAAAREGISD
jgi:AbrB family looped-hinge helix DNA binding protein